MLRRLVLSGVLACFIGQTAQPASARDEASIPPTSAPPSLPGARSLAAPSRRLDASPAVVYRYDSLGRLVRDQRPGTTLTYTYDAAGNRVQSTVQH